jgi:GABA permease
LSDLPFSDPVPADVAGLKPGLQQRHLGMIALGGVIGAGLFVGSGVVIQSAGPATVVSFLITGLLVVLVMKMLGEMAIAMPTMGSFYRYAHIALGRRLGFLTGWMYWYFWVIVIALEAIAGAKLIQFWLPDLPTWIISLTLLVTMTFANLVSVRVFGETEFWLASIKVIAIIGFLIGGSLYVAGLWPVSSDGLSNLVAHGGFMPKGILPVLTGAVTATGFYFGAELVTIAAAESDQPGKAIARATSSVITRVLFFYIGSILLIVAILPWNGPGVETPFVSALARIGLPAAAQVMNAVILTAVLSALNSGVYASSRILFALTSMGDAPKGLARLDGRGVPVRAILLSTLFGYASIVISYVSPDVIFPFLINSYGTVAIFVYLLIAMSHIRLSRTPGRLAQPTMWGMPALNKIGFAGMIIVVAAMGFIDDQRLPLIFGIVSAVAMLLASVVRDRVRDSRRTGSEKES